MRTSACAGMVLVALAGGLAAGKDQKDTDYEKLLKATTFSLAEAIEKALSVKEAKDCVVVSAEIEEENGKIIYSMELAKGDKILEINFDVTNGTMLPLENEDHDKSAQAKAAKLTVKEAIAIAAKKKTGNQPVEATLVMKEGKPVCQVKVWTAKKALKTLEIDALTGDVVKGKKDPGKAGEKDEKK